jgi:hypothetical protein
MAAQESASPGGWAEDEATDDDMEQEFARQIDGFSSFHDADELPDVDAAFRSQRRIAVAYFAVFATGIVGAAAVTTSSRWAVADRVLGGFSPSFLIAAVAIYVFVVVLGLAAATLANGVDDRMLGAGLIPASPLRHLSTVPGPTVESDTLDRDAPERNTLGPNTFEHDTLGQDDLDRQAPEGVAVVER